jgi:hypothetical protein
MALFKPPMANVPDLHYGRDLFGQAQCDRLRVAPREAVGCGEVREGQELGDFLVGEKPE